ncbi:hypothetical protein ACFQI7_24105 [Paenibacillus allorhizosphaerae]|uniref:Uncharacterized protein n=1 Tax=Paenibacillus allorhizosphaerae TaxID=2849866 RepID=A0ABN7TM76_9BACL|nr:hypothetical protein [Paenibacillus allorhizosphaerae]CAG7646744.1 hypothetical protein PAECIP111802_03820 [Paenibacillus allorhizosphaerae]
MRVRKKSRTRDVLFGYDAREARRYFSALDEQIGQVERQREQQRRFALREQARLKNEAAAIQAELAQAEKLEAGLKKWIRRNRNP